MNKQLLIGGIVGALAVTAVAAVAGYRAMDPETANVGREVCSDEVVTLTRQAKDPDQIAGTVVGAVVGGLLGNQVGGGSGKKLATVGGAIAGGVAGNKLQENMQAGNTYQETQRNCETVYDESPGSADTSGS